MNTGPVTATVGSSAILAALVSLVTMWSKGTIDIPSASASIGVIFAGINSFFSHTA